MSRLHIVMDSGCPLTLDTFTRTEAAQAIRWQRLYDQVTDFVLCRLDRARRVFVTENGAEIPATNTIYTQQAWDRFMENGR